MRTFTILMGTLLCLTLLGCERSTDREETPSGASAERVKEEIREAADVSLEYAAWEKEHYENALAEELERLGDRIDTLHDRLDAATSEKEKELRREALDVLKEKKEKIGDRLEELRGRAADAWSEFRDGLDAAVEELRKGLKKAKRRFDARDDS